MVGIVVYSPTGDRDGGSGDGGDIVLKQENTGPGTVAIFATGDTDASFTLPSVSRNFGDNPLVISTNTTIPSLADDDCDGLANQTSSLVLGTLYSEQSCGSESHRPLYIWTGSSGTEVTGLDTAAGATLTLGTTTDAASWTFTDDVRNGGTLTFEGPATRVTLAQKNYIGLEGSSITTSDLAEDRDGRSLVLHSRRADDPTQLSRQKWRTFV